MAAWNALVAMDRISRCTDVASLGTKGEMLAGSLDKDVVAWSATERRRPTVAAEVEVEVEVHAATPFHGDKEKMMVTKATSMVHKGGGGMGENAGASRTCVASFGCGWYLCDINLAFMLF